MATETRRSDELKVRVDPRLIAQVENYAGNAATPLDYAVADLLRAGLSKLEPRAGGANGKRKAKAVTA